MTQQICKGVASSHELLHSCPSDYHHLPPTAHWSPALATQLLTGQLRLAYRPPIAQLRALGAAVGPQIGGAGWGEVGGLLEAFAECGYHPGDQVGGLGGIGLAFAVWFGVGWGSEVEFGLCGCCLSFLNKPQSPPNTHTNAYRL